MKTLRILHLEDSDYDAELIGSTLESDGIVAKIHRVETQDQFAAEIKNGALDLILADCSLPSFDGMSALEIAKEICPEVPFIFVSG